MPKRKVVNPRKRKSSRVEIKMDDELREQVDKYIDYYDEHKQKFGISALVRAILRIWTNPDDPWPPPEGVEEEEHNRPMWGDNPKKSRKKLDDS